MAVMYQHVQGKASPLNDLNPNLPAALVNIVEKAMTVDKSKRFGSMEEFHSALDQVGPELT
jgi:serine/threonine-protein kinase